MGNEQLTSDETAAPFTEEEKMGCVLRWLNRLYYSAFEREYLESPCMDCPYAQKCILNKAIPQDNFKVLEKYTRIEPVMGRMLRKVWLRDFIGIPVD